MVDVDENSSMNKSKQLNLNTLLILVVTALLGFGIKKLDENNTALIQLSVTTRQLSEQVSTIKSEVKEMVLKSDFQQEINRLNREIDALRKLRTTPRP